MSYVLRRITEEDKEFFINNGVKSPFGGRPGFGRYMVESVDDDVKMSFIGGQGIMKEDGTEWSEMAEYCAILWKTKKYIVEFFSHSKCIDKTNGYETFIETYKIKEVRALQCSEEEKQMFIEIAKKSLTAYGAGGCKTSICEQVKFIDTEVRWR